MALLASWREEDRKKKVYLAKIAEIAKVRWEKEGPSEYYLGALGVLA